MEHPDAAAFRHSWPGVEVRHLAALTAVARAGSFRAAARDLGYAQSAVSRQVASLETAVGARLVERRPGQASIRLTRAGEILAEHGTRILAELQAVRADLASSGRAAIRVAVVADVAPLLPRILAAAREALPGVPIHVAEREDLAGLLEADAADVAIGAAVAAPGIASTRLTHDPLVLLASPGSHIAPLADLAGQRLIVPRSLVSHVRLHAPGLLGRALGVPLAEAVPPLVRQGHGVGLVARSTAVDAGQGLVEVPTMRLLPPQRVTLAWRAARPHAARFGDAAVRAFRDVDDDVVRPLAA